MSTPDTDAHLYPPHILHNTTTLSNLKFLSSCFSGAIAGVLGLENYSGFLLFVLTTVATTALVYGVSCKGRMDKYVKGGLWELVNPGQDNIFSFVLLWTLFYGMLD
jgi:hypothetical protein